MQSVRKNIILILLSFLTISTLNSQNLFTGKITYKISYPDSQIDLATLQRLPRQAEITAENEMTRTEMKAGELNQIKIADSKNKTVYTILELLDDDFVIHKTYREIKEELKDMPEPKITYTNETKKILGYECKRAKAVVYDQFGEESVIDIFYTEEIPGEPFNFDLPYHEIPGLMMIYEIKSGNFNIRYEATSIESKWGLFVGSRNFRIPRNAQEISFEELQEKFQ